ncbi:succinate dehydrogenase assembly factor 2 [Telmatospirillum sp. J64-1]|uniref:succinate dehydrogenase assembly factor 2 n=1 Tax=Telmatospirillum sp. J64-1 TaxID=2502183 RepID=UPI00210354EB|nr:succinate dehydrogenase assembly factor 2 [Telmatospirillum sp. J64-1]
MTAQLKRLMFRAHHMGSTENDIIFGSFADRYLADFTPEQLDRFEALLKENDADLFDWVTGKRPPPADLNHDVMQMLIAHKPVTDKF